jgi:TPR repeat protein
LPAPASAPRQSEDNQPAPSGQEYFQRGYAAYAMQHYDEARSLYLQGAAKGDANSMYSLGKLYAEGAGVSRNFTEAQSWYEKSAAKGNATALYSIGLLYLQDAPGRRRDCAAAHQWLAKAAERGSIAAQKLLTSDQSCS